MYDIIVVGGGPAGMTAALYGLRNGKTVLVIEKNSFGGQITNSPKVENYPGTLSMSGNQFADSTLKQIIAQGADIELDTVSRIENAPDCKRVLTEFGSVYEGRAVVIATGVKHRMLGLDNEEDYIGDGISFCAVCDGDFYKGKTVCVAGGGNSALQEAILLSEKCTQVIMLQDLPEFTGEKRMQDLLFAKSNVKGLTQIKILSLITDASGFKGVRILHKDTGKEEDVLCDGLFVAIGLIPENKPFEDLAALNDWGYFDSGEDCLTRTPGIYVAGDCRSKRVRQLTTAVADGATAALAACNYINQL